MKIVKVYKLKKLNESIDIRPLIYYNNFTICQWYFNVGIAQPGAQMKGLL